MFPVQMTATFIGANDTGLPDDGVLFAGTMFSKGVVMPLSEHEQRVLQQLEESLKRDDPAFEKKVREANVYRDAGRRLRWAGAGFLLGLIVLLVFFTTSLPLGLVGVAVMFASGVVMERNVRRMGRASIHDLGLTRRARAATDGATTSPPPWAKFFKRDQ